MNQLIEQLKQSEQDFEFYPTTDEIIAALIDNLRTEMTEDVNGYRNGVAGGSFLDIGAGHGKVLRAAAEGRYFRWEGDEPHRMFSEFYAIEKSQILCEQLDRSVFIVGTDLHEQSLVSKKVNVTFSNPPYSEFEEWAVKIIRETCSRIVFLVIPVRWERSEKIANAIKYREAETKVIGHFSFEDAEDRTARAKVHLIRIDLPGGKDDAFNRFFDEQFGELKAKFAGTSTSFDSRTGNAKVDHKADREARFEELVVGPSYPDRLVALYNAEMDKIQKNYALVAELDVDLLKEFDVTPDRILGCLRTRLDGLRNTYWKELIANMTQVTDRLTSKKRRAMLDRLNESGAVDFTSTNIHAIIIWILKNANQYLDEQLIDVVECMVDQANVRNYKSNHRVFTQGNWRYNEEKPSHIALEYRIVVTRCGGVSTEGWKRRTELNEQGVNFIGDLLTVARNLGFACPDRGKLGGEWVAGEKRSFLLKANYKVGDKVLWSEKTKKVITDKVQLPDGAFQYQIDGEWLHEKCVPGEPLIEVRAFQVSNLHIRLNQKFALALNVEYGRLKGWLRSGKEAAEELGEVEAAKYFGKSLQLGAGSLMMLASGTPANDEVPDLVLSSV